MCGRGEYGSFIAHSEERGQDKGMEKLGRKIQIGLTVFLGLCSLAVNGGTFYILANYHTDHYRELAEVHMSQQYQNCSQRLSVLGEQIRLFGEDEVLVQEITDRKWSEVGERIGAFIQSSSGIESFQICTGSEETGKWETRSYGVGNVTQIEPELLERYLEKAMQIGSDAAWFLREGESAGEECLSYLMRIGKEDKNIGFFLANVPADSYMNSLTSVNSNLWEEHLGIVSESAAWYSDRFTEENFSDVNSYQEGTTRLAGDELISVKELTGVGEQLVQVISLKTGRLLLPAGLGLLLIFLISLVFIYFASRFISRTITVPLDEMREKMKNTLNQ